jgi:hypothetical protein
MSCAALKNRVNDIFWGEGCNSLLHHGELISFERMALAGQGDMEHGQARLFRLDKKWFSQELILAKNSEKFFYDETKGNPQVVKRKWKTKVYEIKMERQCISAPCPG